MSDTTPHPAPGDPRIVRAAIHPAIGIARVGNSPDEFFYAPEVVEPLPAEPGFYKDAAGALKRQAQRFRVYGYDARGEVVRELTAADAEIAWTVHVANKKAAWYDFEIALDIPEAATQPPSEKRNKTVTGADRAKLAIDPGARTIAGRSEQGPQYAFDSGTFYGKPVYLGELRTDEEGRLVFLGGHGVSASFDGKPATTFANNEGWHDDVADGPVSATVKLGGVEIPVDDAWVVVGPPNYAPDVVSVRTIYDLLYDVYVQAKWITPPAEVSFTEHVYPVLQRLSNLEWVNKGFAAQFGWGGPNQFTDPEYVAKLSAKPAPGAFDTWGELRRQVFNAFRPPQGDLTNLTWPWIYGDAMGIAGSPRQNMALSPTQYGWLQRWAAGQFVDDWGKLPPPPHALAEVPVAAQPAMLDQAALHFCLADAFHPGCEMTWPVRHATLYTAPFRIKRRETPEPDYGPVLTPEIALSVDGPLYGQEPGDLSRWMAVPWQTDTASCRSGYDPDYDSYLPTFWPARVPNQVLALEQYAVAVDPRAPMEARQAAFSNRQNWLLMVLSSNYRKAINEMISDFGKLSVVELRPGVPDDPAFPPVMGVASKPGAAPRQIPFSAALLRTELAPAAAAAAGVAAPAPTPETDAHARAVAEAGWESEEDLRDAVEELLR